MTSEIVSIDTDIHSTDVLRFIETDGAHALPVVKLDAEAVAKRIDARIMSATSVAEVLGTDAVLHAQDYLNTPFQLLNVEWRPSDQPQGLPFYAVLTITSTDGEIIPMTTGARSVMIKAAKLHALGALPLWVRIVKNDKPTEAGNFPLDLMAADGPEAAF